jgi:transcriptional regulator GlxA family with amidase domain
MNSEDIGESGMSVPVAMTDYSTFSSEMKPIVVGVLGFDGVTTLDLTGPLEAFATVNRRESDRAHGYNVFVIGLDNKTFASESGVVFRAQNTLETAPPLDTLIIPGGLGIRGDHAIRTFSDWLNRCGASVRRIAAVSTGIYALASTGVLKGRQVTTHWRFAQPLARKFPEVHVNYTASFLKDGMFYSCGGGTAAIEMTLSLIEEDYGVQVALSVARELVVELRPPGGDRHQIESFDYQVSPTERLADLPAWIAAHLRGNLSVEALAKRTSLSPRHFGRLFKRAFKTTPAHFVEQLRLDEARRRLLVPRHNVDSVAASVGFASAVAFRRAFGRCFGASPSNFRSPPSGRSANGQNHKHLSIDQLAKTSKRTRIP